MEVNSVLVQNAGKPSPDGLAQVFIIGEEFIGDHNVTMVLGYSISYGNGSISILKEAAENTVNGKAKLEEIAYNKYWIDRETLLKSAKKYWKSPYGEHLKKVAAGKIHH